MPGRSMTRAEVRSSALRVKNVSLICPSLRSTVTPGKLPTCWFEPVSWLKSVVLPLFCCPARAKVSVVPLGSGRSVSWLWYLPASPIPGWALWSWSDSM